MKLFSNIRSWLALLFAVFFLQSCGGENIFQPDYSNVPPPFNSSQAVSDTTLPGGVKIYVIEEGGGPFDVVFKDQIIVKFTGRTAEGEIFESSYTTFRDEDDDFTQTFQNLYPNPIALVGPQGPFTVPPEVEGFRKGLLDMREGEKRIIVVPPEMGSSGRTRTGINLEGKTLIYNVELVEILGTYKL